VRFTRGAPIMALSTVTPVTHSRKEARLMRPKQIAITAAVALAVVVGFNAYAAKKG